MSEKGVKFILIILFLLLGMWLLNIYLAKRAAAVEVKGGVPVAASITELLKDLTTRYVPPVYRVQKVEGRERFDPFGILAKYGL